jgi:hypothetical protein
MPTSHHEACDLITSAEARAILGGRRLEPYYRRGEDHGRITPVMRAGSGPRSPLLFRRADVEKLRDEILAKLNADLAAVTAATPETATEPVVDPFDEIDLEGFGDGH